jgi:NAD(P)-dependent dehydrogenase (short-subunit alcohol dehydrogenase family)
MSVVSKFDLTGKAAVVTGGSRGIGREIVKAYAEQGADVVIASRDVGRCEELASEIRQTTGRKALPVACHVGRWQDCDALIDTTLQEFGRLDILVNNAGMFPAVRQPGQRHGGALRQDTRRESQGTIPPGCTRRHLHGRPRRRVDHQYRHYRLPDCQRRRTTLCLRQGRPERTHSRAGRGLRPESARQRNPAGAFATDISKAWPEELRAGAGIPLGRTAAPEEIIGAAVYLASEAASYTTGASIRVDGGVTRKVGG